MCRKISDFFVALFTAILLVLIFAGTYFREFAPKLAKKWQKTAIFRKFLFFLIFVGTYFHENGDFS